MWRISSERNLIKRNINLQVQRHKLYVERRQSLQVWKWRCGVIMSHLCEFVWPVWTWGESCWSGPGWTRSDGSWSSLSLGASAVLIDPPPLLFEHLLKFPGSSSNTPPQYPVSKKIKYSLVWEKILMFYLIHFKTRTEELVVDFSGKKTPLTPISILGQCGQSVQSQVLGGVLEQQTGLYVYKKGLHHLLFLRRLQTSAGHHWGCFTGLWWPELSWILWLAEAAGWEPPIDRKNFFSV